MSHFAEIEPYKPEEGLFLVKSVIVAEQDFIDSGSVGDPSNWVQTSYNSRFGVHYEPQYPKFDRSNPTQSQVTPGKRVPSGKPALRHTFAGTGFIYDKKRDVFYPNSPFPSWILEENTYRWKPPIPYPQDINKCFIWSEDIKNWQEVPCEETSTETPDLSS